MDPDDFRRVPVEEAKTPTQGDTVYEKHYWALDADDNILFFNSMPQTNTDKRIIEHVIDNDSHPGVKVHYFDALYINR